MASNSMVETGVSNTAYEGIMLINGTLSLKVKSISVQDEPIWSSNTGRSSNGTMTGDIIGWKKVINTVFCPMTDAQAVALSNATHNKFYTLKFINPNTGTLDTITCYAVPVQYPVYSYVNGFPRYNGVAVNFTEK